eukprot:PhF_6_TR27805/c1_g2_i7/m.40523/K10089/M6PR; cation-dependent mannose-6-phosphate receptor
MCRSSVPLVFAIVLVLYVTDIYGITCSPASGIDFTNVPSTHCSMTQVLDGTPGSNYNFDFNWCNQVASSACPASYIVQGNNNQCDRAFTVWQGGMGMVSSNVMYSVDDGAGSSAVVAIACDQGGANNVVTCPSQYNVKTQQANQYQYTISLKSKCACPNGCSGSGPGPAPGPGGNSGSEPSGGLTGGGVFLIIFFVSATVYIGAGTVYNYKVKGMTGAEAFPNLEFWKGLPGLCKDGCLFFVEKVKGLAGRGGGSSGGYTPA